MAATWPYVYGKIALVLRRFEVYAGHTMRRLTAIGVGLVITAGLLFMIGCRDGGESGGTTPDSTGELGATATLQSGVQPPTRPADFASYPAAIAAYLTEAGDAALALPCLAELLAAWQMAEPDVPLTPEERCLIGNTDADADDEVVALFTAESEDGFGLFSNVVVFDKTEEGYEAVYQSWWASDRIANLVPHAIVAAEDITGDGAGNLAYTSTLCGAHTCTVRVHVLADGAFTGYMQLTPEESISMETADVLLEDRDGDGVQEIVLHGGTISSVGAGVQRTRTEVYAWNGVLYELAETIFDASGLLYFAIRDADLHFDEGNYGDAADAYRTALADGSLVESGFQENERPELNAYAVFRFALSQLAGGGSSAEPIAALEQSLGEYAGTVNVGLGDVFAATFANAGGLHGACLAVRDHISANLDSFQAVWEYGYANPTFDAENVCPF